MTDKKEKMKSAIPKELLAPLGKILANFAVLESVLDFQIGVLTVGGQDGKQRVGQIITAELSFQAKVGLLSSLYQHELPNKTPFEDLKKIRKKLRIANEKRNSLVHSTWSAEGNRIAITAKEKHGIKFEFEKMSAKQIEDMADFISEVANEVMRIFRKKQ